MEGEQEKTWRVSLKFEGMERLSLNHKYNPPVTVECVRLELDAFAATDVVGALPDDPRSFHGHDVPSPHPRTSPRESTGSSGRSPTPRTALVTTC
jgi:hypothetical protein